MRRSTRFTKWASVSPASSSDEESNKSKHQKTSKKATPIKTIRKKNLSSKVDTEPKTNENKERSASSSSESDIEDYLQPADQIDLDSTFFKVNQPAETKSFDAIESNIFSGVNRLSDSDSEEELQNNADLPVKRAKIKETNTIDSKPTSSKINFQQLHDYTTKLEEAKKLVEKYEASKRAKLSKKTSNKKTENHLDISHMLALGETKVNFTELQASLHSSDFESNSDSEKEDWEEVEGHDVQEKESIVPKDGVQIIVEMPGGEARKKKGIDLVACMKRRLNKIKKDNQMLVHKVHLLCWLAHGNYLNNVLNNESVLAMALSLIPSQHCYPSDRTDLSYLEQIVKWYKNSMPLVEKEISKIMTLEKVLKTQISRKQTVNKKMFIYIFICILRSLGVQCRLVLSFQVASLRPPASELLSLSTKSEEKGKDQEASSSKKNSSQKSQKEKTSKKVKNEAKGKEQSIKKPRLENLNSQSGTKSSNKSQNKEVKIRDIKESSMKPNLKAVSEKIDKNRSNTRERKPTDRNLKQTKNNPEESNRKTTVKESSMVKSSSEGIHKKSRTKILKTEPNIQLEISDNLKSKMEGTESENTSQSSLASLKIPQVDGANDSDEAISQKPNLKKLSQEKINPCHIKKHPKRLKLLPTSTTVNCSEDCSARKISNSAMCSDLKQTNLRKLKPVPNPNSNKTSISKLPNSDKPAKNQPSASTDFKKFKQKSVPNTNLKPSESLDRGRSQYFSQALPMKPGDIRGDIISLLKGRMAHERSVEHTKLVKSRRSRPENDYDSDYAPEPMKKKPHDSDDEFYEKNKVKVKQRVKVRKDAEEEETKVKRGVDVWVEVYLEAEEKWISADVIKGKVHCIKDLYSRASHPVTYIVAWNNDNSIKDITQRYCPNWNTVTRKLRIDTKWWEDTLRPFEGRKTARDREEDEELARLQLEQPLPTTISEYKNHPLYVLKRHMLKFEALYPPEPITLGFVRGEPVYSRRCVHTLHSREVWIKYAKVVKPGQEPYKIVKARAKYDKLSGQVISDQALELFGKWQVEDYVPPTAKDGIVPRNAYGNVDLFKPCMLPKGTVHLQLPGLNKLARRMNIDCAPAVVGFDFHSGGSHPTFDGFIVCEEHSESLIAAWYMEQEEQEQREKEKREKRIYGNWKKLIKGLLIRERLKARYDFGKPSQSEKRKSKGPKLMPKKRKICSESESD